SLGFLVEIRWWVGATRCALRPRAREGKVRDVAQVWTSHDQVRDVVHNAEEERSLVDMDLDGFQHPLVLFLIAGDRQHLVVHLDHTIHRVTWVWLYAFLTLSVEPLRRERRTPVRAADGEQRVRNGWDIVTGPGIPTRD